MSIIVLTGSRQETSSFSEHHQIGHGIRHIVNRDTLRGFSRVDAVHELPSFQARRDVHALRSQLERIRRTNRKLVWVRYDRLADGSYVPNEDGYGLLDQRPAAGGAKGKSNRNRGRRHRGVRPPETVHFSGADVAKNPEVAIDTSVNAVPGQTAIEEHIAAAEAPSREDLLEQLAADVDDAEVTTTSGELDADVAALTAEPEPEIVVAKKPAAKKPAAKKAPAKTSTDEFIDFLEG